MITARELSFAYDGKPLLFQGFSWEVGRAESWAVIGPSGCGKTTLLYLLAGLRFPTAGSVLIGQEPLRRPRLATGLILQDYGLLPWASARANILVGLKIRGTPRARRQEIANAWLERLGLAAVAHHYPSQLSGGQRQRVAIARTLALQPDLLLMDEPFSSLDALTREELQNLVVELGIEGTLTTVLVTHSIEEAVFLGRRIMILPQPPIQRAIIIDNPLAGQLGYRGHPAFHCQCSAVRQRLQGVLRGD